jgi:hypothetical protein
MKIYGYIKNNDFKTIYHEGDIRLENPHIKEEHTGDLFPQVDGYEPLYESGDELQFNFETQSAEHATPIKIDGKWVIQYQIREKTAQEFEIIQKLKEKSNPLDHKPGSAPDVI